MISVTKKVGENIHIGEKIIVRILGINGNQVRIGIKAPKQVEVHRLEVYDKIHAQDKGPDDLQH